jgi:hypothetical protein
MTSLDEGTCSNPAIEMPAGDREYNALKILGKGLVRKWPRDPRGAAGLCMGVP